MPKIKDIRIIEGKKNRNKEISTFFNGLWNSGFRYEVAEEKTMLKYGISGSTLNRILKTT